MQNNAISCQLEPGLADRERLKLLLSGGGIFYTPESDLIRGASPVLIGSIQEVWIFLDREQQLFPENGSIKQY